MKSSRRSAVHAPTVHGVLGVYAMLGAMLGAMLAFHSVNILLYGSAALLFNISVSYAQPHREQRSIGFRKLGPLEAAKGTQLFHDNVIAALCSQHKRQTNLCGVA